MALQRISELLGYRVQGIDRSIGHVVDMLFHDQSWQVRYLVLGIGEWFQTRSVLVQPQLVSFSDPKTQTLTMRLSYEQLQDKPLLREQPPIYLQRQEELPFIAPLWSAYGSVCEPALAPVFYEVQESFQRKNAEEDEVYQQMARAGHDIHLRSVDEIRSYSVANQKEQIGVVYDLLLDDESWQLAYLLIDTGHWFVNHKLRISTDTVTQISWKHQRMMSSIVDIMV